VACMLYAGCSSITTVGHNNGLKNNPGLHARRHLHLLSPLPPTATFRRVMQASDKPCWSLLPPMQGSYGVLCAALALLLQLQGSCTWWAFWREHPQTPYLGGAPQVRAAAINHPAPSCVPPALLQA
jgi:hypothetical protein